MENENSIKLLNALGKNVAMATQSLDLIIKDVKEEDFKTYLSKLSDEYNLIFKEIQMLAKAHDVDLKLTTPIEKAQLWTSIKLQTMFNKSTRKFATMIYLGTNMGIPDLIFAISDFGDANKPIVELAKKLKDMEEKSNEDLKIFLSK